jgi:hypothetical protein
MKTKKPERGAIFTFLAGLITSAIAGAASQEGGGVQKRKRGQTDLVAASI